MLQPLSMLEVKSVKVSFDARNKLSLLPHGALLRSSCFVFRVLLGSSSKAQNLKTKGGSLHEYLEDHSS